MRKTPLNKEDRDAPYTMEDLVYVMARLRDPDGGCPWDLAQDFRTIAPYTIEEAYEVADAIERNDMDDLCEELGDLLLQPVYHAQMATEAGYFDIHNVIHGVTEKMITRHPHVFGQTEAQTPEDVNKIWDERKAEENTKRAASTDTQRTLDGVAQALPALLRAQKLQSKAAKVGFEWPGPEEVLNKLEEELGELRSAMEHGTLEQKADELGDILFVMVNLGRMLGVNAETALRQCNDKFVRRFSGIEDDLNKKNKDIHEASLAEMEALWTAQKQKEK